MSEQQPNRQKQGVTSGSGYDVSPLSKGEIAALATKLGEEERRIILHQGTEHPFCGTLLDNKKSGIYTCRLCGLPLFRSRCEVQLGHRLAKFYEPFDTDHVAQIPDSSHGMARTEIRCRRCDAHLGHVFPDGPPPTGLRYCLNSASLEFYEDGMALPQRIAADRKK